MATCNLLKVSSRWGEGSFRVRVETGTVAVSVSDGDCGGLCVRRGGGVPVTDRRVRSCADSGNTELARSGYTEIQSSSRTRPGTEPVYDSSPKPNVSPDPVRHLGGNEPEPNKTQIKP